MSLYGKWTPAVVDALGTLSSAVDLEMEMEWLNVYVPSVDSTTLMLHVSTDGVTYALLGLDGVPTAATTGTRFTTLELGGYHYVKVLCGSAQTLEKTFWIRGYRR